MKRVFSFLLFSICSSYLSAQTQPEYKVDSVKLKKFLQQDWVQDLLKRQQRSYQANDTALFSHKGSGGDVYLLPQDKMPCLRPDTNMYVYNHPELLLKPPHPFILKDSTQLIMPAPGNTMPNAYQVKPLVWKKIP